MMQQRNMFQTKEWDKASGEGLSDVEIGNLLKKRVQGRDHKDDARSGEENEWRVRS